MLVFDGGRKLVWRKTEIVYMEKMGLGFLDPYQRSDFYEVYH